MKKSLGLSTLKVKSFTTSVDHQQVRGGISVLTQHNCPPSNPYDCPDTGKEQTDVLCGFE